MKEGIRSVGKWLYWLFWESWHGTEASAYEITRSSDPFAPVIEIGNFSISRRLLFIIIAVTLLILGLFLVSRLAHFSFVSSETLASETGSHECVIKQESTGRVFVAVDCLLSTYTKPFIYPLIVVLAFLAGYATRIVHERRKQDVIS